MSRWSDLVAVLTGRGGPPGAGGDGPEGRAGYGRTTGYPTSSNRASSMHLFWELPPGGAPIVAASARLLVEATPPVDELYFWALQGSFTDGGGHKHGGAHLGLQWHASHPGSRAANWGGYAPGGGILPGSESALPSATGNANTRDLWWEAGEPHTLTIERSAGGGWAGSVDGARLRTLAAGGDRLDGLMVWSEVFARCDAPPVAVRWSGLTATDADGVVRSPVAVRVNYQRRADGGCDNTTAEPDGDGVRQLTATPRRVAQGARLPLG